MPVGLGSPATVTITDDDATGVTVTLGAASVSEDLTRVTVTARLNVAVQGGFTVLASTVDGSAIAGSDYTAVTGTLLTFAGGAGEEQTFPVTIVGDDVAEGGGELHGLAVQAERQCGAGWARLPSHGHDHRR